VPTSCFPIRPILRGLACLALGLAMLGCRPAPADTPIAFLAQGDGVWQVWWVKTPQSKPERVTRLNQDVARLSWFPNGRELLLNLQDGSIVTVDVPGGRVVEVPLPAQDVVDAAICPDGRRIAYSVSFAGSSDRNDIWIYDMTTRQSRKLTSMPGLQHDPVWSVDGRTIYFLSGGGPQAHNLWRVDVASGDTEQITVSGLYHLDPTVRADGAIAYSGNRSGDYDVWLLTPGGEPEPLTRDPALDARPSWSPSGEALVYESAREGGISQLWRYDLKAKNATQITDLPGGARMPVWAPAGERR
jgi:TolB protein